MRITLLVFFSFILLIVLSAVGVKTEITGFSKYWGKYSPNQKYVLTKDLLLHESKYSKRLALSWNESVKGLYNIPDAPDVIKDYRTHPELYQDLKVLGIVKAGTILQPSRIVRHRGFVLMLFGGYYDIFTPCAIIMNGEFTGWEVDISNISRLYFTPQAWGDNLHIYGRPDSKVIDILPNK